MDNEPQPNQQPSSSQNQVQMQEQEQDFDDLQQLGLFHQSSLKNAEQVPLNQIVPETYNVKRYTDENNQLRVKDYIQMQKLGSGAFAQVKKVKLQVNGVTEYYAMKIYSLMRLRNKKFCAADGTFANYEQMLRYEIQVIKRIKHKNLTKCHEIMYGGNHAFFVMELCDFGQIMDWSQQKNNFVRNPKVIEYIKSKYKFNSMQQITRVIFLQVGLGIQYLHKNNISNRDIKVQNILCKNVEGNALFEDIQIADFSTVRYSVDDISYFTCGTAGFRGPQIQSAGSDGYNCKALDIWSMGISMYTFYYEMFPFMGETQYIIENLAQNQELKFDQACPSWLKNLIDKMTKKNWRLRITIDEVVATLSSPQQQNL